MMNWLLRMVVLLACCAGSAAMATQQISSVRMSKSPDATRIVFDLQAPLQHTVNKLGNPDRIVVDLNGAVLDFDFSRLDLSNSPIREIRTGQHAADMVRVVLDLKSAQRPRTSMLAPSDGSGWRLVVDLLSDLDPEGLPTPTASVPKSPLGQTPADFRPMVIALDPGHGGQDPGAIGPSGTREKDVVLQIAKRLADHINRQPGMRAVLVRTGDYYVPLADRRRIAADKYNADVFLSIHADAFTDSRAHGASVFALSHHGSTSARAGYLARIANDSDKVAGVYQEERENNSLLNVIADLTTSGSLTHSLVLGRMILEEMGQVTKLHGDRRRVEQAGFAVLKEPSMVSLLVETGFISNRNEEKNLRSSAHQEKMAKAIVGGLHKYFEMHPKPETYYALLRSRGGTRPATHQIASGETISSIARRYDISESALREHNKLRGDKIRAGQVLRIPPG
ncbi:MAG: N-acetylmuramoyl-L-alanine amidase [Alcanivoracaceae bacterium]|jgi:N-acetylmuramoyl-L-alanine amidase|nr:N-acetylmuramoyl-L-alanine amidase [Alcanivoracaceae bacterium]